MGHKTSWNIHVYSDLKARAKKDGLPISEMVNEMLLNYYPNERLKYLEARVEEDLAEIAKLKEEAEQMKGVEEENGNKIYKVLEQAKTIHNNTITTTVPHENCIGESMIMQLADDNNVPYTKLLQLIKDEGLNIVRFHPGRERTTKETTGGRIV